MSLHGRIYIERNISLEKQRQREMDRHYKALNQIKNGKKLSYNLKELATRTDQEIENHHKLKQIDRSHKEIENLRNITNDNRKLL